jgi:hypothetical protein
VAFSPAREAFEGFRVLGRNPVAFVVWTLFILAFWIILGAGFWLVAGHEAIAVVTAMANSPRAVAAELLSKLPAILAAEAVFLAVGALSYAVLLNAIARAVLKPDDDARWYLRFGREELLSAGVYLILYLGVVALIGTGAALVWGAWAATGNIAAPILAGLLAMLLIAGLVIWGAVRLCLVLPQVVGIGRIDFQRAWRLTRGRFGPLIGMALLNLLVVYVLQMVVQVAVGPLMQGLVLGLQPGAGASLPAVVAAHWPALAAAGVLLLVSGIVQLVVQYAPFAAAYRELSPDSGDPDQFPASEF